MQTVIVDITDCDLNLFERVVHKNEIIEWVFDDENGKEVLIKFIPTKQEEES